jgi:hypothetical protein
MLNSEIEIILMREAEKEQTKIDRFWGFIAHAANFQVTMTSMTRDESIMNRVESRRLSTYERYLESQANKKVEKGLDVFNQEKSRHMMEFTSLYDNHHLMNEKRVYENFFCGQSNFFAKDVKGITRLLTQSLRSDQGKLSKHLRPSSMNQNRIYKPYVSKTYSPHPTRFSTSSCGSQSN